MPRHQRDNDNNDDDDGDDDGDDDAADDYVGAYFCMNMMLITLSSFLAVLVISAHIRGDRRNPVPRWLKAVRRHRIFIFLISIRSPTVAVLGFAFWGPVWAIISAGGTDLALYQKLAASGKLHCGFGPFGGGAQGAEFLLGAAAPWSILESPMRRSGVALAIGLCGLST